MKKILAALIFSALIAGCDQQTSTSSKGTEPINSVVKESQLNFSKSADGKVVLKWNTRELYEKLGLNPQSGVQLRALLPDQFSRTSPETTYAIHSKPGEEQGLYLQRFPDDKTVRATLTQVDANFKPIGDDPIVTKVTHDPRGTKDIVHKLPFRIKVPTPQKSDALYTLLTELLEKDGTVSDSVIYVIYVSGKVINAELKTDKEVYAPSETLHLQISNNGPTNLSFGVMYLIEKKGNDKWIPLNDHSSWTLQGYSSTPESDFTQNIELADLKAGTYRISKSVGVDGAEYGVSLYDTFEVK